MLSEAVGGRDACSQDLGGVAVEGKGREEEEGGGWGGGVETLSVCILEGRGSLISH